MISRVWHGWTTEANTNADAYEALLTDEIVPVIEQRRIAGFHGMHVLRRAVEEGIEFVTIMWFESMESVRAFAGDEPGVAVVPLAARELLSRFDARSQHCEVRVDARGR
jgi:hypothetical protein